MKTKPILNVFWKKTTTLFAASLFTCILAAQGTYDTKMSSGTVSGTQEGEACIAINPADSSKMVIGFMEQSQSSLNFRVYTSANGGMSWTLSAFNAQSTLAADFPGHSIAGGGDILLAYDKTGKLYCSWIYALIKPGPTQLDSLVMAMYWAESSNNGQSFTLQATTDKFIGRGKMNYNTQQVHNIWDGVVDRQWMACDLSNGAKANNLYCGFLLYPPIMNNTGLYVRTKTPSSNAFASKVLAYPGNGHLSNVLVDGNGVLHYVFGNIATNTVYHCSSSNGGTTFSAPHVIATGATLFPQSNKFLNNRENAAISFAIDGANNLHMVWNDFPGGTFPNAYYSASFDGGATWSVKQDLKPLFGNTVFMPTISANGDRVTISANVVDNAKKSEYYILSSVDNGNTFGSAVKVSSGVTDHAAAKTLFIGDYSTSARLSCTIYSTWTDNRSNGPKQYLSVYNECSATGFREIVPVNSSYSLSAVYPNPAREEIRFRINGTKADKFSIQIMDISGKVLLSRDLETAAGENNVSLNISSLGNGNYLLSVVNSEAFITTKVVTKN